MLDIEIFSDVVCPWCFIGKRRLDRVLQGELGDNVSLRWRPYQLYPNMPPEGFDRADYLARRYGPDADLSRAPGRIAQEAQAEGIDMRYELIERMPNTLLAHQLLEFAHPSGLQHELAEALFVAYFCEGRDVGELQTLIAIAAEVGLNAAKAGEFLRGNEAVTEVRNQLERAPDLGVSGVPGYYLADSFLLPGAQDSDTMAQIITRVKTKLAAC